MTQEDFAPELASRRWHPSTFTQPLSHRREANLAATPKGKWLMTFEAKLLGNIIPSGSRMNNGDLTISLIDLALYRRSRKLVLR